MPYHRYDLPPEPRPHDIGRESATIAIFIGLLLAVFGLAAITVMLVGSVMSWVLA